MVVIPSAPGAVNYGVEGPHDMIVSRLISGLGSNSWWYVGDGSGLWCGTHVINNDFLNILARLLLTVRGIMLLINQVLINF